MKNTFSILALFIFLLAYTSPLHSYNESSNIRSYSIDESLLPVDTIIADITELYEGCEPIPVIIEYTGDLSTTRTIWFNHLPMDDLAHANIDFIVLNATGTGYIEFLPGITSHTLYIQALYDWNDEPDETFTLRVDFNDTIATQVFTIKEQPEMYLEVSDDAYAYCPGTEFEIEAIVSGGMASLNPNHNYSFEWSHIGTAQEQVVAPEITTEYCVQVTDYCEKQILVECMTIEVEQHPMLEVESDLKYVCIDTLEQLCADVEGGEGNYSYDWSNGSNDSCMYDYHGVYTLIVSDECDEEVITQGEIYLDEAPDPIFEYLYIPHIELGYEFNYYTADTPNHHLTWYFGDGESSHVENPNHVYDDSGEYEVVLQVETELASCIKATSEFINVERRLSFYAPNSFTPNNDKINDGFKAIVDGAVLYEMTIYDRYGKKVFSTTDPNEEWDGTYDGANLAQGTYIYNARMTKENDIVFIEERGYVNLLR